ncbi:hypothetical protein ACFQX6_03880 [Streptosporangium lutulentum]
MSTAPDCGWVVIRDPGWPSPYFAELERHAPAALPWPAPPPWMLCRSGLPTPG